MFIFARCLRSSAAVTPAKYELDIIQVTTVLIIRKKWENNGTEKIGLVTPTPGPLHGGVDRVGSSRIVMYSRLSLNRYPIKHDRTHSSIANNF